jgi:DNA-directed RNA polymerase subunit RPC12/RpoP
MSIQQLEHVDLPDPRTTTLFEISSLPGISGSGELSYKCPSCKSILLENIFAAHMARIVFRCPNCGGLSRMQPRSTLKQHAAGNLETQ